MKNIPKFLNKVIDKTQKPGIHITQRATKTAPTDKYTPNPKYGVGRKMAKSSPFTMKKMAKLSSKNNKTA